MSQDIFRNPPPAFEGLPDYPFAPNTAVVDGMRMHFVDEGPKDGQAIFLFHGQPTWSYLYRHIIPRLADAGLRVIAPDLIGFGKSDKPIDGRRHTFSAHVRWMTQFVDELGIERAAAFMQDWGGMIGLRVLAARPDWLSRLVLANTALADPGAIGRQIMPAAIGLTRLFAGRPSIDALESDITFKNWLGYFATAERLEIGRVVQALTVRELSSAEMAAYDAPFSEGQSVAGPRRLPSIVATDLNEVHQAWKVLQQWHQPVLTLFSDKDPFLAETPYASMFRDRFVGAQGQPHATTEDASHFLQEDKGPQLAQRILQWLVKTGFVVDERPVGIDKSEGRAA